MRHYRFFALKTLEQIKTEPIPALLRSASTICLTATIAALAEASAYSHTQQPRTRGLHSMPMLSW
ncbi:MAG: hypothetical protein ACK55Z_22520, partial [bacterium]